MNSGQFRSRCVVVSLFVVWSCALCVVPNATTSSLVSVQLKLHIRVIATHSNQTPNEKQGKRLHEDLTMAKAITSCRCNQLE
jgi:hypothetical protein